MIAHKFRAGQTVRVIPSGFIGKALGDFTIVSVMPEERGVYQYRVKSIVDGHERVVTENEIA